MRVVAVAPNKRKARGSSSKCGHGRNVARKPGAVASAKVKRTRPYRTPQTPHEQVEAEEKEHVVTAITAKCMKKGVVFYEVQWQGYEMPTWEPMANLVGCSKF